MYIKTNWVDNITPVNAENLNKIENGIKGNEEQINDLDAQQNSNLSYRIGMLKRDSRGFYSVNNVGDSISHGANADVIYDNAWTGIVRKALQLEFNTTNHGYVNMYGMSGFVDVLLNFTGWTTVTDNGKALGFISKRTSTADAVAYAYFGAANKFKFKKIIVEVAKNNTAGNVEVYINQILAQTINCYSDNDTSELITINTDGYGYLNRIHFKNITGTNEILNIYFIDDIDKVVFNNFAKSGAKLTDLTDNRIDKIFDCSCLFFSMGYNTVTNAEMDNILAKCKIAYDLYKPLMFVNDFCWDTVRSNVSAKLKQFAKDTNSKYIQIIEPVTNVQTLIDSGFLSGSSHPTNAGHEVVAGKILAEIKTTFQSKKAIEYIETIKKVSDRVDEIYNDGVVVLNGKLDTTDANYNLFNHLKFAIEFKYQSGSPLLIDGLYLVFDANKAMYLGQFDTENYYITNPLTITAGDYIITAPTWTQIKFDAKISIGESIDLATITAGTRCKIVNAVVSDFTTQKTNLKDLLLYK